MSEEVIIPTHPLMPELCVDYLKKCLLNSNSYLEYGSGGSTMLAMSLNVPFVQSVESDRLWLDRLRDSTRTTQHGYTGQYTGTWVDIGETGNWGYPKANEAHASYWRYPAAPWVGLQMPRPPDLILIDGRFRVACLLMSLMYASTETTILFDDYGDRSHYHGIESIIKPREMIDRMAVFKSPAIPFDQRPFLTALISTIQDSR